MPFLSDTIEEPLRKVYDDWKESDKLAFLEVTTRAQNELHCSFTAVAIGLQIYRENYITAARIAQR